MVTGVGVHSSTDIVRGVLFEDPREMKWFRVLFERFRMFDAVLAVS